MKAFFISILLISSIFANNNFWSELNEGIKVLYDKNFIENNTTKSNFLLKSEEVLKSTTQKRENFYDKIAFTIKDEPAKIKDISIDFYNDKESLKRAEESVKMKNKKFSLDDTEVQIELLKIELLKQMYYFLNAITDDYENLNLANLKEKIEAQKVFIVYFKQDIEMYQEDIEVFIDSKKESTQEKIKELKNSIKDLEIYLNMYMDFIEYIYKKQNSIFIEKSVVKKLALNKTIDVVNKVSNEISYIAVVNEHLAYVHTDIGRLLMFFLVIGFFWILKHFGDDVFVPYLKRKLDTPEKDAYDVVLYNFDDIKRPLTYIIRIFGLDLAIDILTYPKETPQIIDTMFSLAFTVLIAWLLISIIDLVVGVVIEAKFKDGKKNIRKELVNLAIKILKTLIFLIAVLIFLKNAGFDITALLTSLGIGGLAVALAAKDTIANFFSSIKIIFEESFSQGDWIKIDDVVEGNVVELGFGSTKIRTFDNALISIPNSILANKAVKNWSKRRVGRRIKMHIGVTYFSKREDIQNAVKEIRAMLEEHPGIATDKRTKYDLKHSTLIQAEDKYGVKKTLLVYLDELSPYSMDILIYAFSNTIVWGEWLEVKEDIIYKIWEILEKNSLEFAFPTQVVYYENQNNKKQDFVDSEFKILS